MCFRCELLQCLAERKKIVQVFFVIGQLSKYRVRICVTYWWRIMVQKRKGVILLVALIAHHTPTLTLCNDTSDSLQKNTCYSCRKKKIVQVFFFFIIEQVSKYRVRICVTYRWRIMVQKRKGVILLVALIAHHTPTLTLCNDTSDILQKNTCYSENSQNHQTSLTDYSVSQLRLSLGQTHKPHPLPQPSKQKETGRKSPFTRVH